MNDPKDWTFIITPRKRLFELNLREVWQYRDLYFMYVKRDFITLYKQTILGPLWYLLQPLLTTVIYMFVFGRLAGISTDGIPQPLFYMSGILLWNYFQSVFSESTAIFTKNYVLFGKVYFPRLIVPLSTATSNLVKMGIQLLLFIGVYLYCVLHGATAHVTWALVLAPLLVLLLAGFAIGWGLIITALTAKYRDLQLLIAFGISLLMYATPVIYPLSITPGRYQWLVSLNPLTPIFETFKYGCLGNGTCSAGALGYCIACCAASLFLGVIIFNQVERDFMDTV